MDPLKVGPDPTKELFGRFSKTANGFQQEDVVGAAANLLLNALRQSNPTRTKAEAAYNELFGKLKAVLLSHYDGAGNRRSVFPFHQVMHVPHLVRKPNGARSEVVELIPEDEL